MSLIHSAKLNGLDPFAYMRGCWDGCRRSQRAESPSCYRTVGKLEAEPRDLKLNELGA